MSHRPTFAFLLPWQLGERGGVNQVVLNLLTQCEAAGRFRPLLIENDWECQQPAPATRFGFDAVRLRIRCALAAPILRTAAAFAANFAAESRTLADLLSRERVAVVNAHFPGDVTAANFPLLNRLGRFSGKTILSLHGSEIRSAAKFTGLSLHAYRWMLREVDRVVACSKNLLDIALSVEPAIRTPKFIHNGFTLPDTLAAPVAREDGTEVIVSVGRYEQGKGHDVLIAAFRRLAERRPGLRLRILGASGPQLDQTRALVAGDSRIQLRTDVPHAEVLATVASADVFAFPSRWEGLGIAILEAGALGIPVVAARAGGIPEIVAEGETGRLFPVDDVGALATALASALDDRDASQRMVSALHSRVTDHFTWRRAWREYEALV